MKKFSTKNLTMIALLSAMSVVVTMFIRIPLVPAVPFLTYDPKDIIIGIGGFLFGPLSAFLVSVIASVIELFFRGGNIIDVLMNVISTCSFILPAAWIYQKKHTKKGAMTGLLCGIVVNIACMVLWNYVMDPIYLGLDRQTTVAMLPYIALFNLLKCSINSIILMLIYKPVVNALRRTNMVEHAEPAAPKTTIAVLAGFGIVTLVVVILAAMGNI